MMKKWFAQIPMRKKLYLPWSIITMLAFLIFAVINTYLLTKDTMANMNLLMTKSLEQVSSVLEFHTHNIKYSADVFVQKNALEGYFTDDLSKYKDNEGLYVLYNYKLNEELYLMEDNSNVNNLELCMNSGFAQLYDNDRYYYLKKYVDYDWYNYLDADGRSYIWVNGGLEKKDNQSITLIRKIYGKQNYHSMNGVIAISLSLDTLKEIITTAEISKHALTYLVNSKGEVITQSDTSSWGNQVAEALVKESPITNSNSKFIELHGKEYIVKSTRINESDWTVYLMIPKSDLLSQNIKTYQNILITLLIILPFIIITSRILAYQTTKPIELLIRNMKKAEKGDFDIPIAPYSKDEIGQLNQSFNSMLTKIDMLLDEKYRLGKEKKNAQLKALQVQINPHFLYNTLDFINLMAINEQPQQIQEAIKALSKYYRLSLNSGSDEATLKDEIDHVKYYIDIQNMRFDNKIILDIDVPEELMACKMFKICLQPLIENSIHHGILEKETEEGCIKISAKQDGEYLLIVIEDDGVGMSDEAIDKIFMKPQSQSGYGIYNVQERILMNYGEDCGISYETKIGVGTRATLKIKMNYCDE